MRPTLSLLAFDGPVLHVRRELDGKLTVAGMASEGESDPAFAEWVLEQKRIRIRDATIVWEDRLRQAPPLVLEDLQLALDNSGRRHRFGLSAAPPENLAARIDIRGEIKGELGDAPEHLTGKLFVELDYADLAGWRAWVDYPVLLPQGRGALRIWGDLDDGAGKVTADVALEELRVRLGRKLPELDLASMRGRLEGRYKADEWALSGHKVELLTLDGVRVAPTDFNLEWRQNLPGSQVNGTASATFLDLAVLAKLASYMPLDAKSRELLEKHRPQGRIAELKASWTLDGDTLRRYSLKTAFHHLGLAAGGYFPGAEGLSGMIDLSEKGGDLIVDSGRSGLSLPAVFPEPDIALTALKARANWKNSPAGTDIRLDKLEFAGPDAAGSAQGSYRYTGDGPGEIDLDGQGRAGRGDGGLALHAACGQCRSAGVDSRGIVAGKGYDGRLVLKGKLQDFPFRDGKGGKFVVTARAPMPRVDYAPGWPAIDGIAADMTFDTGMKIAASQGRIRRRAVRRRGTHPRFRVARGNAAGARRRPRGRPASSCASLSKARWVKSSIISPPT